MVMFLSISRWKPQTARAVVERWMTIVNGTAPKAVLDAFAKYKIITQGASLANNLYIMVVEIEEKYLVEAGIVSAYMQDVCSSESYTLLSFEDTLKVLEALPLEKIPKPESWTK